MCRVPLNKNFGTGRLLQAGAVVVRRRNYKDFRGTKLVPYYNVLKNQVKFIKFST